MEQLPIYIAIVFILTTLVTLAILFKAANYSKSLIIVAVIWLAMQGVISLTGFYTVTNVMPPRFGLLLIPPIIFITVLFFTRKGRMAIARFDVKTLTLLHIVRIPVELTLYWLFLHRAIPQVMTFEGRNFDIFCGLTAPLVYYFGYVKNILNSKVIIAWNVICLLLLANIVITALLSARFPFQKLGFGQPNVALFYFPFVWLPCFVVPTVLFAHLAALRQMINN